MGNPTRRRTVRRRGQPRAQPGLHPSGARPGSVSAATRNAAQATSKSSSRTEKSSSPSAPAQPAHGGMPAAPTRQPSRMQPVLDINGQRYPERALDRSGTLLRRGHPCRSTRHRRFPPPSGNPHGTGHCPGRRPGFHQRQLRQRPQDRGLLGTHRQLPRSRWDGPKSFTAFCPPAQAAASERTDHHRPSIRFPPAPVDLDLQHCCRHAPRPHDRPQGRSRCSQPRGRSARTPRWPNRPPP